MLREEAVRWYSALYITLMLLSSVMAQETSSGNPAPINAQLQYLSPTSMPSLPNLPNAMQLNLNVADQTWPISLTKNTELVSSLSDDHGNSLASQYDCYYQGTLLQNGVNRTVAMDFCSSQPQGWFHLADGEYSFRNDQLVQFQPSNANCGTSQAEIDNQPMVPLSEPTLQKRTTAPSMRWIKLLIANDASRQQQLGNMLSFNTLSIANIMSAKYKQESRFDSTLVVAVMGLYTVPTSVSPLGSGSYDSAKFLVDATNWNEGLLNGAVANVGAAVKDHDALLVLSGRDLSYQGNTSNTGLANLGTLCTSEAVAVVQGTPEQTVASTGIIAAHELGHILNAQHDGTGSATACAPTGSVMAADTCTNCANVGSLPFSTCSVNAINSFFASGKGSCTLVSPKGKTTNCGNGVVEPDYGEQCDNDSICCSICSVVNSGQSCNGGQGTCGSDGQCSSSCGNGVVDPGEECDGDPCCSSSCMWKPVGNTCSGGQYCTRGQCATARARSPTMNVQTGQANATYTITLQGVADTVALFYSTNGMLPVTGSNMTNAENYTAPFTLGTVDQIRANPTLLTSRPSQFTVLVQAQAIGNNVLPSQPVQTILDFSPSPSDYDAAAATESPGLSPSAIVGIVLGVLLLVAILAVLIWYFCLRTRRAEPSSPTVRTLSTRTTIWTKITVFVQRLVPARWRRRGSKESSSSLPSPSSDLSHHSYSSNSTLPMIYRRSNGHFVDPLGPNSGVTTAAPSGYNTPKAMPAYAGADAREVEARLNQLQDKSSPRMRGQEVTPPKDRIPDLPAATYASRTTHRSPPLRALPGILKKQPGQNRGTSRALAFDESAQRYGMTPATQQPPASNNRVASIASNSGVQVLSQSPMDTHRESTFAKANAAKGEEKKSSGILGFYTR